MRSAGGANLSLHHQVPVAQQDLGVFDRRTQRADAEILKQASCEDGRRITVHLGPAVVARRGHKFWKGDRCVEHQECRQHHASRVG